MIDAFPASQQAQARVQLSMVLETVISQQLIPSVDGGLVPVFEILHMTPATRSLIREGKTHQLTNAIASGGDFGMCTMDQSILSRYRAGQITRETALSYAENPEQLCRRLDT